MSEIYFSDLLKEIEQLDSQNPDGFTSYEMSRATGKSQAWCRQKIRELIEHSKMEFSGNRRVERSDKRVGHMPVYKMVNTT